MSKTFVSVAAKQGMYFVTWGRHMPFDMLIRCRWDDGTIDRSLEQMMPVKQLLSEKGNERQDASCTPSSCPLEQVQ